MAEVELRRLLNRIAEQLRDTDLQNMKYLCHGKIGLGDLEKAETAIKFLELLLHRQLIAPRDYVFLEDLLERSNRKDLAGTVSTSGGDRMQTESGSSRRVSENNRYRTFLNQLSDELTQRDLESLKFLVGLPAAVSEKTHSGYNLFDYLEKKGEIGSSCLDLLEGMFDDIHRRDLSDKVRKFKSAPTGAQQIRSLRNTQPVGRQPVVHSELHVERRKEPFSPVSPTAPLLRPGDFQRTNTPVTTTRLLQPASSQAIPPAVDRQRDPRFPVQCEEAVLPLDEEDEMPSYPMTRHPRGIALIISNQHFLNIDLSARQGTEKDIENLKTLWQNLNFEVEVKEELTAHEIYDTARHFSAIDHTEFDCFVCCLMSHGVDGSIYGTDSETIEIRDITAQFRGTACPTLADKPKLFFIQACRGQDFDSGAQRDASRDAEEDAMRQSAEPNESHFLLGYATPPGYVSWRSQIHGSWYISKLCEVFGTYCERYDLMSMMVKVNDEVSQAYTKKGYKQCPAPVVTLRKRVYFSNN